MEVGCSSHVLYIATCHLQLPHHNLQTAPVPLRFARRLVRPRLFVSFARHHGVGCDDTRWSFEGKGSRRIVIVVVVVTVFIHRRLLRHSPQELLQFRRTAPHGVPPAPGHYWGRRPAFGRPVRVPRSAQWRPASRDVGSDTTALRWEWWGDACGPRPSPRSPRSKSRTNPHGDCADRTSSTADGVARVATAIAEGVW